MPRRPSPKSELWVQRPLSTVARLGVCVMKLHRYRENVRHCGLGFGKEQRRWPDRVAVHFDAHAESEYILLQQVVDVRMNE